MTSSRILRFVPLTIVLLAAARVSVTALAGDDPAAVRSESGGAPPSAATATGAVFYLERGHSGNEGEYARLFLEVVLPTARKFTRGPVTAVYWPNEIDDPVLRWSSPRLWDSGPTMWDQMFTRKGTPSPLAFGTGLRAAAAIANESRARLIVAAWNASDEIEESQWPLLKEVSSRTTVDLISFDEKNSGFWHLTDFASGYVMTVRSGGALHDDLTSVGRTPGAGTEGEPHRRSEGLTLPANLRGPFPHVILYVRADGENTFYTGLSRLVSRLPFLAPPDAFTLVPWPQKSGQTPRQWRGDALFSGHDGMPEWINAGRQVPERGAFEEGLDFCASLSERLHARVVVVSPALGDFTSVEQREIIKKVSHRCMVDVISVDERADGSADLQGAVSGYAVSIREGGMKVAGNDAGNRLRGDVKPK